MNTYCEKALSVLMDHRQTWQAKWIATEILTNAGYSKQEISLLRSNNGQSPYGKMLA